MDARGFVVLGVLAACSGPTADPDAGAHDASRSDAVQHDVATSLDGSPRTDASLATDAPIAIDTPAMRDAPVATDAPATRDSGPTTRPGACSPALPAPTTDALTARPKGTTCAALGYYEYVPPGYASRTDWPVILAFHGDGQRGNGTTDLVHLLDDGLPGRIRAHAWDTQRRFVVISPQMDDRNGMTERTGPALHAFIDFVLGNYGVDPHRVYLTGYSGGAEPIYNYLGSETAGGVVAAVLPISGWYSTQNRECQWSSVPIWYFHGAMDGTVPAPDHSTASYDHLVACHPAPSPSPRYTLFAQRGHDDWDLVYDLTGMNAAMYPVTAPGTTAFDQGIYDWLLSHTR